MMQRWMFVCVLIIGCVSVLSAQSRVVTNLDLEKYKAERLKAQQEYRDNYQRLGLPSPEELEQRRVKSMQETQELSAKLKAQRLEEERLEQLQIANAQLAAALVRQSQMTWPTYREPLLMLNNGWYGRYWGRRGNWGHVYPIAQQGYAAGGQFWPTGPRTMPRPVVVAPRGRGH